MDNSQNGSVDGAEMVVQDGTVLPDKSKDLSLVERLRTIYCAKDDLDPCGVCLTCQAANEIERLLWENENLKKALAEQNHNVRERLSEIRHLQEMNEHQARLVGYFLNNAVPYIKHHSHCFAWWERQSNEDCECGAGQVILAYRNGVPSVQT
jgi:hypothetical protein